MSNSFVVLTLVNEKREEKLCETLAQWSWKGILPTKQKLLLWNRCDILAWKVSMGKRGIFLNFVGWYFVELKKSIYFKYTLTTLDISFSLLSIGIILRSKWALQKDNIDYIYICYSNSQSYFWRHILIAAFVLKIIVLFLMEAW